MKEWLENPHELGLHIAVVGGWWWWWARRWLGTANGSVAGRVLWVR